MLKKEKQDKILMTGTVIFSVLFSVGLFMVLPYLLASLLHKVGATETIVTIAEAGVRICLFLAYMLLISRMEDIQRVFMYHEQNISVLIVGTWYAADGGECDEKVPDSINGVEPVFCFLLLSSVLYFSWDFLP